MVGPALSLYWLGVNVFFDILLGIGFYFGLVFVIPRWEKASLTKLDALKSKARVQREIIDIHNALPIPNPMVYYSFWLQMEKMYAVSLWISYAFVKILVWFGVIGIALVLFFSKGNVNPLSLNGFVYDLIYARANDQPNGAHVLSYMMLPALALFVAYKFIPRKLGVISLTGDIYQGVAIAGFLAGAHELLWETWYYASYYQYLTWDEWTNVLRDVSFTIWMILLVLAFIKYPGRTIKMKTLLYPILLYCAFLSAWAMIPYFFGYGILPITTINNPSHSIGLYQETPYFSFWWVNATEVASWVMLACAFIVSISRQKPN